MAGGTEGATDGPVGASAGAFEVGATLRRAREARGASVPDCAAALRARVEQVIALEAGRFDGFGGEVYARGFLRSYARLLGLDPAALLGAIGEGPAAAGVTHLRSLPTERRAVERRVPAWVIGLGVVIVAGAVVAFAVRLGDARAPDAAPAPPPSAPAAPDPVPAPAPPPEQPPEPSPAVSAAPVTLTLTFEAPSWLAVAVDGVSPDRDRVVPGGTTLRYEAETAIIVRLGNAGGVRAELNGEELGLQGRSGEVVQRAFGPDGVLAEVPAVDAIG